MVIVCPKPCVALNLDRISKHVNLKPLDYTSRPDPSKTVIFGNVRVLFYLDMSHSKAFKVRNQNLFNPYILFQCQVQDGRRSNQIELEILSVNL